MSYGIRPVVLQASCTLYAARHMFKSLQSKNMSTASSAGLAAIDDDRNVTWGGRWPCDSGLEKVAQLSAKLTAYRRLWSAPSPGGQLGGSLQNCCPTGPDHTGPSSVPGCLEWNPAGHAIEDFRIQFSRDCLEQWTFSGVSNKLASFGCDQDLSASRDGTWHCPRLTQAQGSDSEKSKLR